MNTKKQPTIRIDVHQPLAIELTVDIVTTLVTHHISQGLAPDLQATAAEAAVSSETAARIARDQICAYAKRLLQETAERGGVSSVPKAKPPGRSRNNPKPRNDRVTSTYVGNRADFERTPVPRSPELERRIGAILALSEMDRVKLYSRAIRLHRYEHELYGWYVTVTKTVIGRPVRRYFSDLEGAVTWAETVRERWQAKTLEHNIPLGGVSRDEFRMGWESQGDGCGRATRIKQQSTHWTAERKARLAAQSQAKRAFHSVHPLHGSEIVRKRATTAEILSGTYVPMVGNNVITAATNGGTAARAETTPCAQSESTFEGKLAKPHPPNPLPL
jgi:hypothetical protein